MSGIPKSEYIRWVKGSLNRLLGASLPDDGTNMPEYRMWLMSFQTNQKLTVNAQVDKPTQNALIKRNRVHDAYVRWVQNALLISGEGIRVAGKAIVANGYWGSDTEQAEGFSVQAREDEGRRLGRRQDRKGAHASDRHSAPGEDKGVARRPRSHTGLQ
jgi:hypothetical protein